MQLIHSSFAGIHSIVGSGVGSAVDLHCDYHYLLRCLPARFVPKETSKPKSFCSHQTFINFILYLLRPEDCFVNNNRRSTVEISEIILLCTLKYIITDLVEIVSDVGLKHTKIFRKYQH